MTVTNEEVMWAYRVILGREPESHAAISQKTSQIDMNALRFELLNSAEYLQKSSVIAVGQHLLVNQDMVKVDCTREQERQMLDRIAAAWCLYGEQEPYWSVLTADEFRQSEIEKSLDAFYASGEYNVQELLALLRRNAIDPGALARVLDFGCGVGRLSLALARHFAHVTGVDISPAHLQLARQRAMQIGMSNTIFMPISSINNINELPDCDLMFSRIVLQHNPPPVIFALLDCLFGRVAAGGYAMFQVPTYIAGYSFDPESYLGVDQAQMEMNALPQRHIFALAAQKGFVPVEVRENLDVGDPDMVSQVFLFRRN
jgi:2-polyprenyl-3-methyl-5-hydroxy-6-metoxy-1,4-benzoquinol methylase